MDFMPLDLKSLRGTLGLANVKPIPFPFKSIDQANLYFHSYQTRREKFIFAWLYLSGQRVSEALFTRRSDISLEEKEGMEFLVINSITEKNKLAPRRSIPIPMFDKEKEMASYIWNILEPVKDPEKKIFGMSRVVAWRCLARKSVNTLAIMPEDRSLQEIELRIHPHYLRHSRASHLAMFRHYGLYQLMQYFGWSSPATATIYAMLNWDSLAENFLKTQTTKPSSTQTPTQRKETLETSLPNL